LGRERARLEAVVETFQRIDTRLNEVAEFLELARDENDASMIAAIAADLIQVEGEVGELEFRRMFSGEMDANNAFVEIQSGTGGTEAQDWASMRLQN
jgi:peptide chain release factor 2